MIKTSKSVKTAELLSAQTPHIQRLLDGTEYAWDVIPRLKEYINGLISEGIDGFFEISEGVLVGDNVRISENAVIEPPAIIGSDTVIRPGAYLRGCVIIGAGCVIGNSTEIKNSLISDGAQLPHYNYVGDSVIGYRAHMGAGAVCSNLKLNGKSVCVRLDKEYDTGLRKLGAILGDNTDIGCNCVLNPGTVVGKCTAVYPLLSLRGVYPRGSIVKGCDKIVDKQ